MTAGGHLENLKNRDISETVWTKYCIICMIAYISPPKLTSWSKYQTFKNPLWRTAAILKIVKCDISASVWPILVKFGMAMQIRPFNLMVDQKFHNPRWWTAPSWTSKNCDISKNFWPILLKFCTITHISSPELTWITEISIAAQL